MNDTNETNPTLTPIDALRRLVSDLSDLMGNSSGVAQLFKMSGVTPWDEVAHSHAKLGGWLGDNLEAARETLRVHELMARITLPTERVTLASLAEPEYLPLAAILQLALDQAQSGKGRDRHSDDKPFLDQPILGIARMLGGDIGGHSYQIMKKAQEAARMVRREQHDAAIKELLGVIVYASAAVLLIKEHPTLAASDAA